MMLFVLFFLLGDISLQLFPILPAITILLFLLACVALWVWKKKKSHLDYYLLAFLIGLTGTAWYAQSVLSKPLPMQADVKPIWVTGYISSLPMHKKNDIQFQFTMKNHTVIRLFWHAPLTKVKVGDRWRLLVKLKKIHGLQNPSTFDFEAWALQKKLSATGNVISIVKPIFLAHHWYYHPIDQIRQILQEKMIKISQKTITSHWLMALIIGEKEAIPQSAWQVLRRTGTNHLMAIGGLHIGLLASFCYCFTNWLWRRSIYCLQLLPASQAGKIAALIIAILYSALAGFALPTQRAIIMLSLFTLINFLKRQANSWLVWLLALFGTLLINPLSILSESFWLSFGTIALIIYGMTGRLAPHNLWWKWGRVQWVIGIGLLPLSLYFFQEASIISFFANSIAIPWLGFTILPLCFFSGILLFIFPTISSALLWLADKNLSLLWAFLTWCSNLPLATWHLSIPNINLLLLTIVGILLLLLPSGLPGRWFGFVWLLPMLLDHPIKPTYGEITLTVLDVGQGLSVVVQTKNHVLLYDAGPRLSDDSDSGEAIVLPFLRHEKITYLDKMIISHGDNDHIGGALAVLKALPTLSIATSVPEKFQAHANYCLADESWQWDGVTFSFLYPTANHLGLGNNSSCVLRISNGKQTILLPGDIEKEAEISVLNRQFSQLPADILIAPHHGSNTSGLPAFIKAVQPKIVIYATGYLNRYHFPHENIVKAYQQSGAMAFNTADSGAIKIILKPDKAIVVEPYRITHRRYWYSEKESS